MQEGDTIDGREISSLLGKGGLNNEGEVVFMARYVEQSEIKMGWFTQYRFLTDVQVTIEDLEVYLLGTPQINDKGDVVFFAAWDTNGDPRLEGSGIVLLKANQAPVAICSNVKTTTAFGRCDASANIDNGSYDPDGDAIIFSQSPPGPYHLGTTEVELNVTDMEDETASCSAVVTVSDGENPIISSMSVEPNKLWPPLHKMVPVQVTVNTKDNCPGIVSCHIATVLSSDLDDGLGDGNTTNDWQLTGDLSVNLRSEWSGIFAPRVYTLKINCTDTAGNMADGSVQVLVAP